MIFGLSAWIVGELRRVFSHYPSIERVLIYGSRAKGTAKPRSDVDLAVMAPAMGDGEFTRLWNDLDDLPLVFKLDVVHWDSLTNIRLKEKIVQEGRTFYSPAREQV